MPGRFCRTGENVESQIIWEGFTVKKRAFGFGLAAAMLLSMAPLSASAEEAERYALKDAYTGDSEQGPVWYYMYNDGEEWKELSHYAEWGDNWQVSADPEGDDIYFSLFDWEGVKATSGEKDGTVYDIAAVWEAPAAGFVAVDAWTFDDLYAGDDTEWAFVANENTEGKVRIEQNGEKLWPEDAEWAEIQAENNVSDEGLTYVEEGDRLFFRVSGAVANVTMDSIAVEYVDIGMDVYMASDALASDQQGPVWYFQYNDGDGWKDLHLNEEWSGKDEQENIIAANWQVAEDPNAAGIYYSIFDWDGIKATSGDGYDLALVWEAPSDGVAALAPWLFEDLYAGEDTDWEFVPNEGTEGKVRIELNGEKLWPADAEWADCNGDVVMGEEDIAALEVKKGDRIYFRVSGNVANVTLDSIGVVFMALEDPTDPTEPTNPTEPSATPSVTTPTQPNPGTGESTAAVGVLALMAVAGGAALALKKKR